MTDPRNDPAASPGTEGGTSPPEQSGQRESRHGLFHRGTSTNESTSSGASGASAVGTTTRSTTEGSAQAVPQQAGQTTYERAGGEERYGRAEDQYGYGEGAAAARPDAMIARATTWSFGTLLLGSLCLIAVGIIMLVWPRATLTLAAILVGAALVATGVIRLWDGMAGRHGETGGSRAASVVIGLLAILVGLYCLRHHALSLFLLSFVVGVYFIVHGIADLTTAASARGTPGRGLRGVLGVFAIAAGIILVVWPGITLTLLLLIVAAWLLFYGVVLGFLAFSIRRSGKKLSEAAARGTMAAPARAA
ncbi:MAG TPA: HdeD family acid-resistance protein [Streptosporangiaceae bacterium]|nr:HdeD family acid-resistance protein [Streptosporangiaceae bacterium]